MDTNSDTSEDKEKTASVTVGSGVGHKSSKSSTIGSTSTSTVVVSSSTELKNKTAVSLTNSHRSIAGTPNTKQRRSSRATALGGEVRAEGGNEGRKIDSGSEFVKVTGMTSEVSIAGKGALSTGETSESVVLQTSAVLKSSDGTAGPTVGSVGASNASVGSAATTVSLATTNSGVGVGLGGGAGGSSSVRDRAAEATLRHQVNHPSVLY